MADTDTITSAGRADIIEGKMLHPFSAQALGTAAGYFRRQAIEEYATIAAGLRAQKPPKISEASIVMELIDSKTRNGDFNAIRGGFISAAYDFANLPFLLWVCIQQNDKKFTLVEASALIDDVTKFKIQNGILELMRIRKPSGSNPPPDSKKNQNESIPSTETQSATTSQNSSDLSEPVASV